MARILKIEVELDDGTEVEMKPNAHGTISLSSESRLSERQRRESVSCWDSVEEAIDSIYSSD
jgi:hypothetical protein